MDEKNKEALGVGTVGAVIGGAIGGPYGAAIGGAAGALLGSHEKKHNSILRDTYYELKGATNGEPKFHVDHINPDGATAGGTKGVISSVAGAPDLVMSAPSLPFPNLIIEVETLAGIQNDSSHAIWQLNDFQTQGYKRVLVTPEGESDAILEWVESKERSGEIHEEVTIATSNSISNVLSDS